MNDYISRQDAIDLFDVPDADGMFTSCGYAMRELKKLPSAQRWIPCSERLPENDDYYLVSIQCEHYDGWDDYVIGFAEWTKHGWDELSCYIGQIKVVAWMPLPDPLEGEES